MKQIIKNLEKQLDEIRKLVTEREEIFEEKTERQQANAKGEAYEFTTQELEQLSDDLENTIEELKNIKL